MSIITRAETSKNSSSLLDDAEFLLIHTLSELARCFELLEFKRHKNIAGNIIYLGMQKRPRQYWEGEIVLKARTRYWKLTEERARKKFRKLIEGW